MTETMGNMNLQDILIIIPAFNEEEAIGHLLDELREVLPGANVLVINDGSTDWTARVVGDRGVPVLDLPCNLGVGGAVQAGFQYAYEKGYRCVVRIDGDGQHPPAEIPKLIKAMEEEETDLIIGSRFRGEKAFVSNLVRYFGVKILALFLSIICKSRVTDPTSGFLMINRSLLCYFAHEYPVEYPEPEAIALLRRYGFSFREAPVTFRRRTAGRSTIGPFGTLYYMIKVGIALLVDRIRPIDFRYIRSYLEKGP